MLLKCGVNQKGLKFGGQYEHLLHAVDVNLLGEWIHTKKENTGALLFASTEIHVEVNAEQAKYMSMSCEQDTGDYYSINAGNISFGSVAEFK
jgi:hypothetical protein